MSFKARAGAPLPVLYFRRQETYHKTTEACLCVQMIADVSAGS